MRTGPEVGMRYVFATVLKVNTDILRPFIRHNPSISVMINRFSEAHVCICRTVYRFWDGNYIGLRGGIARNKLGLPLMVWVG